VISQGFLLILNLTSLFTMSNMKLKEKQFIEAYDKYLDAIFRYCYFKTNNRELSKDLAQDTFMRAWSYLRMGNDVENIRALLYKIAGNTVVDWYRKRKHLSLDSLMETGFDPADVESAADKYSEMPIVLNKLDKLSEGDQQLIKWHYVQGLTPEEMSKNLKQNKNIVSVRTHRAVMRLKMLLTPA